MSNRVAAEPKTTQTTVGKSGTAQHISDDDENFATDEVKSTGREHGRFQLQQLRGVSVTISATFQYTYLRVALPLISHSVSTK